MTSTLASTLTSTVASTVAGIVVVVVGLVCWLGQTISWLAPQRAVELGLMEAADTVEPTFDADLLGEARWDAATLWTMPVAGLLLTLDHTAWPYFGLIGGGMYAYFAGRGISARLEMQRRGLRIGAPANVRIGLIALAVWGITAGLVIVASINELRGG